MGIIRRSIVLSLIPILSAISVSSQEGEPPAQENNLYSVALFASLAEMEKSWGLIDDSNAGSSVRTDYHHMLVEKNVEITNHLPSRQGDYRVEYLDDRDEINRYKKLGKEFSVLRVHPMQSGKARLKISISVYYLKYAKGKLNLGPSDWSEVEFRYDCEKQEFVVSKVKLGGI